MAPALKSGVPGTFFGRLLLGPHILGLDAAIVAVLWQGIAARELLVSITPAARVAIFSLVWAIYLLDRVWDVGRMSAAALPSLRHRAARRWCPLFLLLAVANLGCVAGCIPAVPRTTLGIAVVVAIMCGLYFLWQRKPRPSPARSGVIGVLFALGTLTAPLGAATVLWRALPPAVVTSLLFAANVLECTRAEDRLRLPETGRKFNPLVLATVAMALGLLLAGVGPQSTMVCLASGILLGALGLAGDRLSPDIAAALADAALILPAAVFLLQPPV